MKTRPPDWVLPVKQLCDRPPPDQRRYPEPSREAPNYNTHHALRERCGFAPPTPAIAIGLHFPECKGQGDDRK
ncbi:hypothetical protein TREES_T100000317 [Tupaia chinensis]|uniref:Uncharacterized protein n=1 Tax=Tupaia chinensis TaxID=246437 RepID=L9L4U2_TUPCH|nr:hypothetical protein TREES_T100000317 [Tupaia chinensis]